MAHVEEAFDVTHLRPDLLLLLGIPAEGPEPSYGWIEPAEPIVLSGTHTLYRVRRFREKPALNVARDLLARGCWWNSFVMVGCVPAFLATIRHAAPGLFEAFASIHPALHTPTEEEALGSLYSRLPSANFSRDVLMTRPANLAVLPVRGVTWSDLGEPRRVVQTLGRAGIRPAWAETLASERLSTTDRAVAVQPGSRREQPRGWGRRSECGSSPS